MPIEDEDAIRAILKKARTIAVVGASENPWRDSRKISQYLQAHGYRVIPVNPKYRTVAGMQCYPSLADAPEKIDIVDVFRTPDAVPEIVADTIQAKVPVLWLQLGVIHEDAVAKAERSGIRVIMDRCIEVDHRRLLS